MTGDNDLDNLRDRVAHLEAENDALRQAADDPASSSRAVGVVRSTVAVLLIVLSVVLAPVSALGTWARGELVDTDRFVQTFAPLAEDPDVQAFVADEVTRAIEDNLDIDGIVNDLMDGISRLDLSPRARAAVGLLAAPAAEGVRSLIHNAVQRTVTSDQFARVWETSLRETHTRATAVLRGDPDRALQLSDDGTLTLELGPVIAEVKAVLVDQGFQFAAQIPEIDRAIPLVVDDSLATTRTVYQLATVVGYWLPWIVLGLLVAGVAIARNHLRALAWAGAGFTLGFLLLAAGLTIAQRVFVTTVSPSVMPSRTAEALFDQITLLLSPVVSALIVLSVLVAVGAWLYGTSRGAVAIRSAGDRGLSALRDAADRNGIGTGGVGRAVERWRAVILVATVALGLVAILLTRPASMGSVIGTLAVVLVVMLAVEVVRRPAAASAAPEALEGAATGP